jgi:chemotaxis family two-component system sensor kinase Cph1
MTGEPAKREIAVDLTACDLEPIHIPGSIQPHGVLLVVDPDDMKIIQVAGETETLLGATRDVLLGQSFEAKLGSLAAMKLSSVAREAVTAAHPLLVFETIANDPSRVLDGVVTMSEGSIIVELERQQQGLESDPLALVQRMIAVCSSAETTSEFTQAVAEEVFKATGFDHVMVYQFLHDQSGSVVAEARADGVTSYLGLRYPASDIPSQARRLYLNNWLRLIPDATYTPVPIEPPTNPKTGRPLDLSYSVLRSVSPVHLKYLENMGVRASMSLSIVVNGKLWGLVACHHRTPYFLDTRRRAACGLFARMVSLQFQAKIESDLAIARAKAREVERKLISRLSQSDFQHALITNSPNLLDLIDAGGCAAFINGQVSSIGRVPSDDQIAALVLWLERQSDGGVFSTDSLPALFEPAKAYSHLATGVLALTASRTPRDYILWFRPELTQVVRWAGNPEKPAEAGRNGLTLTPRASFEAWEQTVRFKAEPWSDQDLESASSLRIAILEIVLRALDLVVSEQKAAQSQQQLLMEELDHRIKNTFSVIQSLVRFTGRSASSLEEFNSTLQNRLMAMARVQGLLIESRWEGVSIGAIVEGELAPYRSHDEDAFEISGDPLVLRPRAGLAVSLAIHELMTNAAKYGSLSSSKGQVKIDWRMAQENGANWLILTWTETGGPPVSQPVRAGFGRTLLERTVGLDLKGAVELSFDQSGVKCRLKIPEAQIAPTPAQSTELP